MNSEERQKITEQLIQVIENLEIHHVRRDGDWMRPEDLREVLRLMYFLITNSPDPYEVLPSD